jgi:hypothetical protein
MGTRGARLAVAVLFAIAAAVGAWQYLRADRTIGAERAALAAYEHDARELTTSIVDLRSAQQAYVAVGQGINYWTARFSSQSEILRSRLRDLESRSVSPPAGIRIKSAIAAFDDYTRMDARVREYARSGDQLLASDLIFAEGFEMAEGMRADVDAALAAELDARRARLAAAARRQHWVAGAVVLVGLLFSLILAFAPAPRREDQKDPATPPAPVEETFVPIVRTSPLALKLDEPREAPKVDLTAAADLCRDLAQVSTTQQIPALLDRAAQILDASGIVLWIADPDGRELIPTTTQGYSSAARARLTSIPRDADNATAAAYREGVVHTVKGDAHSNGAVVAPLIAAHGCVGVMAAEVRSRREQQEAVRAIAAIVAAQLATLIGVAPAARPVERRDAAGA